MRKIIPLPSLHRVPAKKFNSPNHKGYCIYIQIIPDDILRIETAIRPLSRSQPAEPGHLERWEVPSDMRNPPNAENVIIQDDLLLDGAVQK